MNSTRHNKIRRKTPRLSQLAWLITLLTSGLSYGVMARDYFNPELLQVDNPQQGKTDLSVYEESGSQAPGTYHVDIYLNNDKVDTRDVTFKLQPGQKACSRA